MSQPECELLESQDTLGDWPDFSPLIDQLRQEATEEETEATENAKPEQEDKSEAVAGLLNVVFMITEQATSLVTGVDFQFDEAGKQQVIDAAEPVFNKHGSTFMGVFGNYIEEATLLLALLALMYTARKELVKQKAIVLKQRQLEKAERERQRRMHGQETQASASA
ncbi:hypothetical protein CSW98_14065 [Vibrio sp. HA2012]|uniref:hypothetical protein n=1 Tax=Vibrio sp. HA2012 TaxID=1971595 RepID=UPI000C2B56D5|nr:hypothetical protein [Vibrio sp. HA2012]PJC85698.1 hypothetical protein CSW98_14065 [Vibrio sp. HA2012]